MINKEKKPNRLIREKSPYLLQHAYNPVDWYPWGKEAFEAAEKEDKLIFLSIGYATCHWCHVMENESFEDPGIAAILNQYFISIKVDREERPDVDRIYMDALHAMDIRGGWPLNMFLTPDKKPVTGGTYFPPVARYGRISFRDILLRMHTAWTNQRKMVSSASEELTALLRQENRREPASELPDHKAFEQTYGLYEHLYDVDFGGFTTDKTNKFPPSMGLAFLIRYYLKTGNPKALQMTEHTLTAIKKGGIYDQIGGGISRYSTDYKWLVPHFEKMLYDNALFLQSIAECFQITGNVFYQSAAYDVIRYIDRDMKLPEGGIASAEDADSEGAEGKFYVWSKEEFSEVCKENSPLLEDFWNVTREGNFEGMNILNEDMRSDFYQKHDISREAFSELLKLNRSKLLEKRNTRTRPLRDDKVITSWNCLYIKAMVTSGMVFQDEALIREACRIYSFIYKNLFDAHGRLMRRYRENEAGIKAYLSDYAELAHASLFLYRATFDSQYFQNARSLTEDILRLFPSDFGPFHETGEDGEQLIQRSIDGYDGVEPSGNSTTAHVLITLAAYGVEANKYIALAEGIFKYFSRELENHGISYPYMLSAYLMYSSGIREVAVIGSKASQETKKILGYINSRFIEFPVVAFSEKNTVEQLSSLIPLLQGRKSYNEATVYVCENQNCKPPVTSLDELRRILDPAYHGEKRA
jgi:uncharacterized protein YyaL (SSP411 family)